MNIFKVSKKTNRVYVWTETFGRTTEMRSNWYNINSFHYSTIFTNTLRYMYVMCNVHPKMMFDVKNLLLLDLATTLHCVVVALTLPHHHIDCLVD